MQSRSRSTARSPRSRSEISRREAIDKFKKQQKASEITEDDYKDIEKDIQKLTDDYIKEVESIAEAKEKELFEI